MTSVQALREFINERLTAAAVEIFTVFEQTIVQYEEEIDRQRKLLQIIWNPQIKLHRTEPPKQDGCAEEQLLHHQGDSSLELEEVDPPQIKEEQEELCAAEAGDQLQLSLESGSFMMAFTNEQSYFSQPEADLEQPHSPDPAAADGCDSKKGETNECGFAAALEASSGCYDGSMDESPLWQKPSESQSSKPSYQTCSQTFSKRRSSFHHQRRRVGEKKHCCKICRESFSTHSDLLAHVRSHTDEKPYSCEMCGKRFGVHRNLMVHMRTHTGEKPYSCAMCGRSFSKHSNLLRHIRTHTGEKPFPCALCDKSFRQQSHLLRHRRTHRE